MKPSQAVAMLVAAFRPNNWDENSTKVYLIGIGDLTDTQIETATMTCLQTKKFMPTIAELRETVTTIDVDTAGEAWAAIINQVQTVGAWGEPWLTRSQRKAVDALGGWKAVCASEQPDILRAHFLKIYAQTSERDAKEAQLSPKTRELLSGVASQLSVQRKELSA